MNKEDIESIIKSFKVSGWNLSKEREFMENLYVGRFNYFLVVFSLFAMAGFANNFKSFKSIVFYAGVILLFMVWLLLYRGYKKHDRIMRLIFSDMKDHPAHKLQKLMKIEGYKPKYKVSKLMGIYIPWFCIIFLLLSGVLIDAGILK